MSDLNFEDLRKGSEEVSDYKAIHDACFVDLTVEMERPEILLSIGMHEYKGQFYDTPIMTAGEFSAIVATSKSKKTFLKSAFLASYIGNSADLLFPNIKTHRDKEYSILDFDTEQGKYYTQRTFKRVYEIAKLGYPHYHGYATRHLSSPQRLGLIDFCLKNQKTLYKEPVKLISIDGIADLVENTNDIVMSKEASDYILRWTYEYNLHITTVIHKSQVTNKPLGHLGTYVLKKAETVIDLEIEDNYVKVTNPFSRGYKFDEFSFYINKDSLPEMVGGF